MNKKEIIKYIGKFITALSFLFIAKIFFDFDVNFRILLKPITLVAILLSSILLSSSVILNSLAWRRLIEMLSNSKVKTLDVFHIYARANMGKYLPGNFMHYASRNIIGDRYNIQQTNMFYSTALEIILKILSAFIMIIIFVRKELVHVINELNNKIYLNLNLLLLMVLLMLFFIVLLLYFKNKKNIDGHLRVHSLFYAFTIYTFIFIINVFVFLIISSIITESIIFNINIMYISGVYVIAWLLGYLTPGSPGGIGIRESIMVLMLSDIYTIQSITLVSIVIRLITILADLISYIANLFLERKVGKANETNNTNTLL